MKKNDGYLIRELLPQSLPWYVARRMPPAHLLDMWPELVGTYLAERARPVCLEADGLLVLAVRGSALRQELKLSALQIIDKLNQAGFKVRELKMITARPESAPTRLQPEQPPLSAEEEEKISQQVVAVKNPVVRESLQKMLRAATRAKKVQAGE